MLSGVIVSVYGAMASKFLMILHAIAVSVGIWTDGSSA